MRIALVSAVLGGLVGAAAATIVTALQSSGPVAAMAAERPPLARPVAVPPGWDTRFVGRLSGMESRLSALEKAKPEADRADAGPPDSSERDTSVLVARRNAELELQYQRDLDEQAQKLIEHDNERVDEQWARGQEGAITSAFDTAVSKEHPFKLSRVECRSSTCVAGLTYASAADALQDVDALMRAQVLTCNRKFSALTPPTGPGEYTRTVIYGCGEK
jgi:hypothetical protein